MAKKFAKKPPFAEGDIVQLKSGGLSMTVEKFGSSGATVQCTGWDHETRQFVEHTFYTVSLKPVVVV